MATTPAIPNTDRIVSYSPVGATSDFIVPWVVIADSEILAEDDLVVIVNGVTFNSSQFSFGGNVIAGLSGIWNGGTVTLTAAVSGVRVIIYSKRDPRRVGNYLEGKTLPFTTLDKLVDDETVQMRDLALRVSRSFKTSAANYFDNGDAEMTFSAATLEAVVAAYLAGISPAVSVAGWARTLTTAKALYAAPVVLANGHTISVAQRSAVGDGYGGLFSYDSSDAASTFSQDALGFVDNQGRRFKRVRGAGFALASWFGAIGDNVADDFTALQAALTTSRAVLLDAKTYYFSGTLVVPANTKLVGIGPSTKLRAALNTINLEVSASNVQLSDFTLSGIGTNVIALGKNAAANNITIERVGFLPTVATNLDQCISLYTCSNVRIDKCDFAATGYGVIQINGYVCSSIKVTGCYFSDMYGDAVLFNGAGSVATDILIEGNTFTGSHLWATPATERRFVGLTSTDDVRILNNWVKNCAGDAAVHMESTGKRAIIAGNTFIDCNVASQNGIIYLLSNSADVNIYGNTFVKTDAGPTGTQYCLSTASAAYTNRVRFAGNFLYGDTAKTFSGVEALFYNGTLFDIDDNTFTSLTDFITMKSSKNIKISNNKGDNTTNGIYDRTPTFPTGNGGLDIDVFNNVMDCATRCLETGPNSNATNPPQRWRVKGNTFKTGNVTLDGIVDLFMMGNTFGSTVTVAVTGSTRAVFTNWNFKDGTGLV